LKVLSIDWGSKRIGLALGDAHLKLVIPLKPIDNDGRVFDKILERVRQHKVDLILLGLPLTPSGREGQRALEVREFAKRLQELLPKNVALEFWDERYTTEEALRLAGNKKKEFKDSLSAYVILNEFFDSL